MVLLHNKKPMDLKKIVTHLIFIVAFIGINSCQKYLTNEKSTQQPTFSVDTVQFDTVFQSIGSATQYFLVRNNDDKILHINSVKLARGDNSPFRMNFNGKATSFLQDIDIPPNDSVYVFTEVTINPAENAILEKDSIIFNTNNQEKDVKLIAYGQDIHLIKDTLLKTTNFAADKPYLIINPLVIDKDATLTIEQGATLHFARDASLIILGTIIAEGTPENPISFRGARLEHMYDDVAGQWDGIWLTKISKNNFLNYTSIKNANIGIRVDSVQNNNPMLKIFNSVIQHNSQYGIFAQMSTILGANLVVADCGICAMALTRGGAYQFYQSTIVNHWQTTVRNTPAILLNNYLVYNEQALIYNLSQAYFGNCIIYGNLDDEILADTFPSNQVEVNYMFDNCMVKMSDKNDIKPSDKKHFITPKVNIDPKFKAIYEYDFQLDSLSPARSIANPNIIQKLPSILNFDILNNDRLIDTKPDLGAYEFIPQKPENN